MTGTPSQSPPRRQSPCSWRLREGRSVILDRPRIMAILNTTPDSFSDGGVHLDPNSAARAAAEFVREGADLLDIGGESTRPGSSRVSVSDQIARVVPVIRAIRDGGIRVPISVDTTRSAVAAAAVEAGADAINDVSGGEEDPAIISLAADLGCGLVLMHRLRTPDADQYSDRYSASSAPEYRDVVRDVRRSLIAKAKDAIERGVGREAILLDPGLGFGKTVEQNLALTAGTATLATCGFPLLGAASRKSFVGRIALGPTETEPADPADRLGASIAFSLAQLTGGIRVFRVHDVREQSRALRTAWRLLETGHAQSNAELS